MLFRSQKANNGAPLMTISLVVMFSIINDLEDETASQNQIVGDIPNRGITDMDIF